MEKISDALHSISTKKEQVRRAFEFLQTHYSCFQIEWSDIDSHFSSLQTSLETRFKRLQSNQSPPQQQPPPTSSPLQQQQQQQPQLALTPQQRKGLLKRPLKRSGFELKLLCIKMDLIGIRNFMLNEKYFPTSCKEVTIALMFATDPAKLVLDTVSGLTAFVKFQETGPSRTCLLLLKGFSAIGQEIQPEMMEQARKLAVVWKEKANPDLYLQLLVAYGLKDELSADEAVPMILEIADKRNAVNVCRGLGLDSKVSDIIEMLSENRQFEAIRFACAFGLVDRFPPIPMLEAYLKDPAKGIQNFFDIENNSDASQKEPIEEIHHLTSVLQCINENKLESQFFSASLEKRIEELKNKMEVKKGSGAVAGGASAASKSQQKRVKKRHRTAIWTFQQQMDNKRHLPVASKFQQQRDNILHQMATSKFQQLRFNQPHQPAASKFQQPRFNKPHQPAALKFQQLRFNKPHQPVALKFQQLGRKKRTAKSAGIKHDFFRF